VHITELQENSGKNYRIQRRKVKEKKEKKRARGELRPFLFISLYSHTDQLDGERKRKKFLN